MFQTTSLPWDLSPSSDSPTEQEPFDMVYTPRAKTDTDVILLKKGYEKISHISDTLQGAIYSAKMTSTSSLDVKTTVVVIKQTSRDLHSRKLAKTDPTNGEMRKVTEDILKEVQIMQAIDKKMPKDCIFSNSMVNKIYFYSKKNHLSNSLHTSNVCRKHPLLRNTHTNNILYIQNIQNIG